LSELPSPQYNTPAAVAGTYCVPWNPNDPLMPLYQQTALQFDTDDDPTLSALIMVALQNQMMLYRKGSCTDCATQGLPPTQTVIGVQGTVETQAPAGAVQTNTTDITEGVVLGTAAKFTASVPIVGQVTAILADIANIFGAAHAQAVAEEQAVNCAVAYAFNKYIPQYDLAVANGTLSASAALSAVIQIIQQQLQPELDPVISGNNWGWGANQMLQAHLYFRQQWYPMLAASLESQAGSVLSSVGFGSLTADVAQLTANPLLLAVLAIGAFLLLSGHKEKHSEA
jgi:hypothetical protein